MRALIVSDIFGVNTAFKQLKETLENNALEVLCLDPYSGQKNTFESEEQAYPAFMERCGHDQYFSDLLVTVKQHQLEVVIGFSSGASAAWKLANEKHLSCRRIIGFYPSLVVHPVDTRFAIQTTVVFPSQEKIFDLVTAVNALSDAHGLRIKPFDGDHGFMNPVCSGFDEHLLQQGLQLIRDELSELE